MKTCTKCGCSHFRRGPFGIRICTGCGGEVENNKKQGYTLIEHMIVVPLIASLILLSVWVFKSKMEANAFNNVTGKSVSTWSAMWIELRVNGY